MVNVMVSNFIDQYSDKSTGIGTQYDDINALHYWSLYHMSNIIITAHCITGATRLVGQQLTQAYSKEEIKAPQYWLFVKGIHRPSVFPSQRASYTGGISISWRHHVCGKANPQRIVNHLCIEYICRNITMYFLLLSFIYSETPRLVAFTLADDKNATILICQCRGYRWPGAAKNQDISSNRIDLGHLKYSTLCFGRFNAEINYMGKLNYANDIQPGFVCLWW